MRRHTLQPKTLRTESCSLSGISSFLGCSYLHTEYVLLCKKKKKVSQLFQIWIEPHGCVSWIPLTPRDLSQAGHSGVTLRWMNEINLCPLRLPSRPRCQPCILAADPTPACMAEDPMAEGRLERRRCGSGNS